MNRSEIIKELAIALSKFNGEVSSISKDAKNPQFRSDYVTLDTLIKETRPVLQKFGLSVMQFPLTKETGEIGIQTLLIHESGEYLESEPLYMTPMKMLKGGEYQVAKDPQSAGSVISYLRRYSYQAILNLSTGEDDDGNASTPSHATILSDAQVKRLYAIGKKAGQTPSSIFGVCKKEYGVNKVENMTKEQYDNICDRLEKSIK